MFPKPAGILVSPEKLTTSGNGTTSRKAKRRWSTAFHIFDYTKILPLPAALRLFSVCDSNSTIPKFFD